MGIEELFARDLAMGTLDGVAKYYELVESQLHSAKEEDRAKKLKEVRSMGLRREDELVEWDLAMQKHDYTFNMLQPNYFRYSCIVLLYLVLENRLGEVCKAAHSSGVLPAPPKPRGNIIESYKNYLEAAGISNRQWEAMSNLSKIRNCIVHASGKVLGRPNEADIRELANSVIGIEISGTHDLPELQPLYLEDDMLMLEPEYCRSIIKTVRDFFEELCDSLSLTSVDFE